MGSDPGESRQISGVVASPSINVADRFKAIGSMKMAPRFFAMNIYGWMRIDLMEHKKRNTNLIILVPEW